MEADPPAARFFSRIFSLPEHVQTLILRLLDKETRKSLRTASAALRSLVNKWAPNVAIDPDCLKYQHHLARLHETFTNARFLYISGQWADPELEQLVQIAGSFLGAVDNVCLQMEHQHTELLTNAGICTVLSITKSARGLELSPRLGARLGDVEVLQLGSLTHLRQLHLCGAVHVSDAAIGSMLSKLLMLEHLSLKGCANTTDGALAPLENVTRLQSLDLTHTAVNGSCLRCLTRLPYLTRLNLDKTRVNEDGLLALCHLAELTEVSLLGTSIAGTGLAGMSRLQMLHTLTINSEQLVQQAVESVAQAQGLVSLTLGVHKVNVMMGAEMPRLNLRLVPLINLRLLKTLRGTNLCLLDEDVAALCRLPALELLSVGALRMRGRHPTFPALRTLLVLDCRSLPGEAYANMAASLAPAQELSLYKCETLSNEHLRAFVEAARQHCPRLESLKLCDIPGVNDEGLRHLADLPSLQLLSLRFCPSATRTSLQHVTCSIPSLMHCQIFNCQGISGPDVEQIGLTAARVGLRIQLQNPFAAAPNVVVAL